MGNSTRKAEYTAAFDRKLGRWKRQINADCVDLPFLEQAFSEAEVVRDRIVESAVITDQGRRTRTEQQHFERETLRAYDTWLCQALDRSQASAACRRHFTVCELVLQGATHW